MTDDSSSVFMHYLSEKKNGEREVLAVLRALDGECAEVCPMDPITMTSPPEDVLLDVCTAIYEYEVAISKATYDSPEEYIDDIPVTLYPFRVSWASPEGPKQVVLAAHSEDELGAWLRSIRTATGAFRREAIKKLSTYELEDYLRLESTDEAEATLPPSMQEKPLTTVIEAEWEPGKCGGLASAQNPQVQLQANHLTWMGLDLVAEGPCGKTVQAWILTKSRWGLRRPKIVHVLAHVSKVGNPYGPRRIRCECELPSNEVVTIVLACSSEDDGQLGSVDRNKPVQEDGGKDSAVDDDDASAFRQCSADPTVSIPRFRLTIATRKPLAQGPVLLPQRKGQYPMVAGGQAEKSSASKSLPPTSTPQRPISARRRNVSDVGAEKIPIFAKAYLNADEGLEENICKGIDEISALSCRRSRQAYTAEVKSLLRDMQAVRHRSSQMRSSQAG